MSNTIELILQEETTLPFKDAIKFLRISRSTMYRRIWDNEIVPLRVGKGSRLFFKLQDLLALRKPATLKLSA